MPQPGCAPLSIWCAGRHVDRKLPNIKVYMIFCNTRVGIDGLRVAAAAVLDDRCGSSPAAAYGLRE